MEGIQSASSLPRVLAKILGYFLIWYLLGMSVHSIYNGISVHILIWAAVDKVSEMVHELWTIFESCRSSGEKQIEVWMFMKEPKIFIMKTSYEFIELPNHGYWVMRTPQIWVLSYDEYKILATHMRPLGRTELIMSKVWVY